VSQTYPLVTQAKAFATQTMPFVTQTKHMVSRFTSNRFTGRFYHVTLLFMRRQRFATTDGFKKNEEHGGCKISMRPTGVVGRKPDYSLFLNLGSGKWNTHED